MRKMEKDLMDKSVSKKKILKYFDKRSDLLIKKRRGLKGSGFTPFYFELSHEIVFLDKLTFMVQKGDFDEKDC